MTRDISNFEKLSPIKVAASQLGLPYWKLLRAVKAGLVPSYRFLNSRQLVRPSEIVAVMDRSRTGGDSVQSANSAQDRRSPDLDDPVDYLTQPKSVLNLGRVAEGPRNSSKRGFDGVQLWLPFDKEGKK
jgi:hypothetical protein